MLPSERNTPKVETKVRHAFEDSDLGLVHDKGNPFFEHGHWWIGCTNCSCQWSVVDTDSGFDFEQVSGGDPMLCSDED